MSNDTIALSDPQQTRHRCRQRCWAAGRAAPLVLALERDDPELGSNPQRNNDFRYYDEDPKGLKLWSVSVYDRSVVGAVDPPSPRSGPLFAAPARACASSAGCSPSADMVGEYRMEITFATPEPTSSCTRPVHEEEFLLQAYPANREPRAPLVRGIIVRLRLSEGAILLSGIRLLEEDQRDEDGAHDDVYQPAVGVHPVANLWHHPLRASAEQQVKQHWKGRHKNGRREERQRGKK
jgi:hypothetical protein